MKGLKIRWLTVTGQFLTGRFGIGLQFGLGARRRDLPGIFQGDFLLPGDGPLESGLGFLFFLLPPKRCNVFFVLSLLPPERCNILSLFSLLPPERCNLLLLFPLLPPQRCNLLVLFSLLPPERCNRLFPFVILPAERRDFLLSVFVSLAKRLGILGLFWCRRTFGLGLVFRFLPGDTSAFLCCLPPWLASDERTRRRKGLVLLPGLFRPGNRGGLASSETFRLNRRDVCARAGRTGRYSGQITHAILQPGALLA